MATLEKLLKTGQLGPIVLGISPFEAVSALGEPQDQSKKKNPLELKYGSLQLTFWKHAGSERSQLMDFGLYYQPTWDPVPDPVAFTDVTYDANTTEREFRSFLHSIHYLPAHSINGKSEQRLMLPSGVVVSFSEGKLHSLKAAQQRTKEKTSAPLSDEQEPSRSQIDEMLQEAISVAGTGAVRAGFVMAWSGLEAALRQVALRRGLQGRIGVQPTILMRELFSAHVLNQDDMSILEEARQARTGIVHGLAPRPLAADAVSKIAKLARRLMDEPSEGDGGSM
jgi:hypothetical protein